MEPRFDIPRRRAVMPVWRICLLMGLTALVLILLSSRIGMAIGLLPMQGYV